jgi:hypothetical protein
MSIDAHVSRRATQTFPFPVRNVLLGFRIAVLFGHSEVNDMNDYKTYVNIISAMNVGNSRLAAFVPGRPMRKLSGLISR